LALNWTTGGKTTDDTGLGELRGPRLIIAVSVIGFVLFLAWSAFARVDEVTRGEGRVIPSSKLQVITSAEPGAIQEILVRSGQTVRKGQLLVRMDDSQSASQLGQIEAESQSLAARAARLSQEGQGRSFGCSAEMLSTNPSACRDEQALQQVRSSALNSKVASLTAVIDQRRSELSQAQAAAQSLANQLTSAREKRELLRPAVASGTIPRTELNDAERTVADLEGQLATTRAKIPGIEAAIRQAQADTNQANLQFRQEALDQRNQISAKLAVNAESQRGASSRLERAEIRAPMDGIVNDVQVTTVGGFVNAGQKIMEVVPLGEKLLIEARVKPSDIAFIQVGDRAMVKVTAYDFSIYGGLEAKVVQVSADSIFDEAKKEAFYTVIVETDRAYLESSGSKLPITPGMICTADIITGRKSVLDYLLKPVRKASSEALRER